MYKVVTDLEEDLYVTFRCKKLVYYGQTCALFTMSDVTTSLRFNQSKMELELQKGLQTTISHDMKTPISSITQSVEMLLQGLVTDPKALQLLKPIQSAC